MKKLLGILVLGLLLSLNAHADDIKDFQIEGISLGDSALDYFDKKELKKVKNQTPSKFYDKFCSGKFSTYEDGICFYTKKKDKSYIIASIAGFQRFPNDIESCYKEQIRIDKEIGELFSKSKRNIYEYKNPVDRSGQSTEKDIVYTLEDGSEAGTACLNWGKKYLKKYPNSSISLQVFLDTKKYAKWLKDGMK